MLLYRNGEGVLRTLVANTTGTKREVRSEVRTTFHNELKSRVA